MQFPADKFERFCNLLTLNSKEQGRCRFVWNGSQRRFIDNVTAGLDDDVHRFVVLKARQLGITTAGIALDLFWLFRHKGIQGALAVSSEAVRDQCRNIMEGYLDSLAPGWKFPCQINNRTEIRFANKSRLAHLVAGGRNAGALGRSQGLNYLHATEVSSWQDQEGIVSLEASLAETNVDRLYFYESTARGFNVFHDMWRDGLRSKTTRAVFIGWWAKHEYAIPRESRLWGTYGRERLTHAEGELHRAVRKLYGYEITKEQWAWWRWKWAERGESKLLFAEFPFTAEQAFVMTGDEFFPAETLERMLGPAEGAHRSCWAYRMGARFEDTELLPMDEGPLSIWEEPDPACDYVIAADPAYGESDWADCFAVQVLKCSASGMEQVAEFSTPDCTMYGFAWVLAHLAGAYSTPLHPPTLILELGGPGRGVLQELQRMPDQYAHAIDGLPDAARGRLLDLFGSIQHFLYHRPDTFSGARLLQWETTRKTKTIMMNMLRDCMERRMIDIKSPEFIDEARYVTQSGGAIQAEGRLHKDDRIVAMGLAVMAWSEQLRPALLARGELRGQEPNPVQRSVADWLAQIQQQPYDRDWKSAGVESWQD